VETKLIVKFIYDGCVIGNGDVDMVKYSVVRAKDPHITHRVYVDNVLIGYLKQISNGYIVKDYGFNDLAVFRDMYKAIKWLNSIP